MADDKTDNHNVIPIRISAPKRATGPSPLIQAMRSEMAPSTLRVARPGPATRAPMGVIVHGRPVSSQAITPSQIIIPGQQVAPVPDPRGSRWPVPGAAALHASIGDYDDGTPIFQWATAGELAPQDDTPVSNAALINPGDYPVMIEEVRFNLASEAQFVNPGTIGVKLDLGPFPITNDFAHLFAIDGVENIFLGESNPSFVPLVSDGDALESVAAFRWRPPGGIYLPPRGVVSAQFTHFGLNANGVIADLSYSGKQLSAPSQRRDTSVPFVVTYAASGVNYFGFDWRPGHVRFKPSVQSSTEQQLWNSLREPVNIKKLTGRFLFFNGNEQFFSDENYQLLDQCIYVRLRTSRGYKILKDFAPFRLVFGRDTRCFDTDFWLDPGEYLIAEIKFTAGNLAGQTTNTGASLPTAVTVAPVIGMMGHRSVSL